MSTPQCPCLHIALGELVGVIVVTVIIVIVIIIIIIISSKVVITFTHVSHCVSSHYFPFPLLELQQLPHRLNPLQHLCFYSIRVTHTLILQINHA